MSAKPPLSKRRIVCKKSSEINLLLKGYLKENDQGNANESNNISAYGNSQASLSTETSNDSL